MEDKSLNKRRRHKINFTPGENDFAGLDKWAHSLRLEDGRPLTTTERNEERVARNVGRPTKPQSAKAKRVMISMSPELMKDAGIFAKRTGRTLSGLIAESLVEKIKRKAS